MSPHSLSDGPHWIAFQLSIVLKHPSAHISSSFFPFLSHFSIHLFSKGELVQIFRKEPSPPVLFSRLVLYFWYFRKVLLKPCWSPFSICIPSSPVYVMGLKTPCLYFLFFSVQSVTHHSVGDLEEENSPQQASLGQEENIAIPKWSSKIKCAVWMGA